MKFQKWAGSLENPERTSPCEQASRDEHRGWEGRVHHTPRQGRSKTQRSPGLRTQSLPMERTHPQSTDYLAGPEWLSKRQQPGRTPLGETMGLVGEKTCGHRGLVHTTCWTEAACQR